MRLSYLGIENLDFVIVVVMCCIPETNETNFQKKSCNDIEKNCGCGYGGSTNNIFNIFWPQKIHYCFVFKYFFLYRWSIYSCSIKHQKKTDFAQQRFSQRAKTAGWDCEFCDFFPKHSLKVFFFVNFSLYFVLFHMFAKHDQFCKQQTAFKVS